MDLVKNALNYDAASTSTIVLIPVDRFTLEKRRWRGVATDGREFGFDLEHALHDGETVFEDGTTVYRISQQPEAVLWVELGDALHAARLGWLLGNLHFRIAVAKDGVQAPDDPAVRQLLEREQIHFQCVEAVFHPLGGGHTHGAAHGH